MSVQKNLNFDLLAIVGGFKLKFWVGKKICNDPTTSNVYEVINDLPTVCMYYKVYKAKKPPFLTLRKNLTSFLWSLSTAPSVSDNLH